MSTTPAASPAGDEQKLRAFVEQVTGGKIVAMERQIRWRPAWFLDVEKDGEILPIHLRGDRQSDILPFPELRREADILEVLGEHGIPVPKIYGVCNDPPTIVMAAMPGSRDVSTAASDTERRAVARQYIEAMIAIHRVPVEAFVARGIRPAVTPDEISLAGLEAYFPLYAKNKKKPEPLLEFSVKWLRNNVPAWRTKATFIQFDAGQFLFEQGKLTTLYDFEFSMIGDPLTDLASMRMRHPYEPTGASMSELCQYYAELNGEPLDEAVVNFQTALFSTVSSMQIAGAMVEPQPGDPHDVYLEWDLALRKAVVQALAACMGITLKPIPDPLPKPGPNATLLHMLKDTLSRIQTPDGIDQARKTSGLNLVECLLRADGVGAELERQALDEAQSILGKRCPDSASLDAEMEAFVKTAGPEHNERLLRFFAAQVNRRVQLFGPTGIGRSGANFQLAALS